MSGNDMWMGMAIGQSMADASAQRRRASSAESSLYAAQRKMREMQAEIDRLNGVLEDYRTQYRDTRNLSVSHARVASAGLVFMNSMLKALPLLPEQVREKFKSEVVSLSKKRILEIDAEEALDAKKKGYVPRPIMQEFSQEKQYYILGFDKK